MVTFTSGQSSCTARAMMWAASWRMSSSAGASSAAVTMASLASLSIGCERSARRPSMRAASAALPSDFEMSEAMVAAVVPAG